MIHINMLGLFGDNDTYCQFYIEDIHHTFRLSSDNRPYPYPHTGGSLSREQVKELRRLLDKALEEQPIAKDKRLLLLGAL